MKYLLLTGATGLLGRYLLRDLTLAGVPLAVVVRRSRWESATQRIETAMARWEQQLGRSLLRPVVWEGDVTQPQLGLSGEAQSWIAGQCDAVLHSAASLTFVEEADGEPWKSNLQGTRHVLELLRATGISQLHHVSTAYICGLRRGKILETEVNVGQTLGNPYEESKLASEQEVIAARTDAQVTIYRPAIIVGDSQTGFTTTYHGFYTPLRLAHALSQVVPLHQLQPQDWLGQLQLRGTEGKNLVPVDWVSAAMTALVTSPQHHGRTYHLTNPRATSVRKMLDAFSETMHDRLAERSQKNPKPSPIAQNTNGQSAEELLAASFREQMKVYQSYWRDDPAFDSSQTQAALPNLPCPAIDRAAMHRLTRFALEANFGWPREASLTPAFHVEDHLRPWLAAADHPLPSAAGVRKLNLEISGPGGGQWQLAMRHGQLQSATLGHCEAATTCLLTAETCSRLLHGPWHCDEAIQAGRLIVAGEPISLWELSRMFENLRAGSATPAPQNAHNKPTTHKRALSSQT